MDKLLWKCLQIMMQITSCFKHFSKYNFYLNRNRIKVNVGRWWHRLVGLSVRIYAFLVLSQTYYRNEFYTLMMLNELRNMKELHI